MEDEYATIIEALKASEYLDLNYPISGFDWNHNDGEPIFTCKHCNKELVDDSMEGMKNHLKEHGITGHIEESKATEYSYEERAEFIDNLSDEEKEDYEESTNNIDWENMFDEDGNSKSSPILKNKEAQEGGFGSGKKGHVSWMSDMEYGGNYRVCPNCNVNTLFESKKCTLCGL